MDGMGGMGATADTEIADDLADIEVFLRGIQALYGAEAAVRWSYRLGHRLRGYKYNPISETIDRGDEGVVK